MSKNYRGAGYRSYYGRKGSGARTVLKWIIVFLLAVLAVAVGLYFLLQNGLIYDDNGVHISLPWNRPAESEQPSETPSDPLASPDESPSNSVLVIESSSPSPEPVPSLTPRELARETLHAVEVTPTLLLSGRVVQQVEREGGNAVLVEMKRDNGTLAYVSSVELAVSMKASGSDTTVNSAIRELVDGEYYTIAQVSCFRDDILGGVADYALLSYSGYRWRDFNGMRWSCVGKALTQDYIVDLCVELAQMGFDEILLTNCAYPPNGTGEMLWLRRDETYPWGTLDTVVGPFLARVKEALAPYGTALSVMALGSELTGETAFTGLTMDNVLESCDHVWLDGEDPAAHADFAAAGVQDPGEKLVLLSAQPGGEEEPWALKAE